MNGRDAEGAIYVVERSEVRSQKLPAAFIGAFTERSALMVTQWTIH